MAFLDDLARKHGVPYRLAPVVEGHRSYLIEGVIVINETLTPERAHWAYCHELAHLKLKHAGNPPRDDSEEREQETGANHLAAEILLPEDQFVSQAQKSLSELKGAFPFASHEVLARRRLGFRFGLLTIFDNGRMTARLAPDGWNLPARLFPLEQQALKACLDSRDEIGLQKEGMQVEATYVDEGCGVIRVIMFLEGEEI